MESLPLRTLFCCLFLTLLFTVSTYAADIGYQGTHILTHGALESLAKAFEKKYGVKVFVKGGGCSDGIAVVVSGRHAMGGACCPLTPDKAKKYNLIQHKVAVDIKAVIVNPKNKINNLTLKQISDIHNGLITNWKQVGGIDKPIALIFRDHCRDMDEPVRKGLGIKGAVPKKAIIVKTDKGLVEYVQRFPDSIAVVSRIFAQEAKVRMINIDGIAPTPDNTERGLYPLKGDLYIITKEIPDDFTKKFLEFALSDEGQAIIGRGFARVR